MTNLIKAISIACATKQIAAYFTGGIFHSKAADSAKTPYLTYWSPGMGGAAIRNTGKDDRETHRMRFTSWGSQDTEASIGGDLVCRFLMALPRVLDRPTNTQLVSVNKINDFLDQEPDRDNDAAEVWMRVIEIDYIITIDLRKTSWALQI